MTETEPEGEASSDALIELLARAILKGELQRSAANLFIEGEASDASALAVAIVKGVEEHWRERIREAGALLRTMEEAGIELLAPARFIAQRPNIGHSENA